MQGLRGSGLSGPGEGNDLLMGRNKIQESIWAMCDRPKGMEEQIHPVRLACYDT